ncbi:hypothetical protein [Brevundimonas vancanneytii]|uniref:Uncharacterized protein n=1 Tax=Brevundimonas vancanneytii TaxID=1325724 RepID=A0A4P1K2M2_9CAUL|nr:hypothetical protein [Brevundimonas vancanneytii]VTO14041.1 Uncharacterised protein [Brevundimonas vancanneytii]
MSGGVRAALDQAVEGEADMGEIVQAGLFEELEPCETGALDAPSPLSAALPSAGRRPGRPKGSKNRRTEAVTAWLLQQHRHPLAVMMEAYSMAPAAFAKSIGITSPDADTLMDIVKLQLRMAEAVAPYVAQKLPQAVQVEGGAALTLNFGGVHLGAGGVSSPARGEAPEISVGAGMAVRLGQVGREKSDADLAD